MLEEQQPEGQHELNERTDYGNAKPPVYYDPETEKRHIDALAKIEEARFKTQEGWQQLATKALEAFSQHQKDARSGEQSYTKTLSWMVIVLLAFITIVLTTLTFLDKVQGESVIYFLGTLTGSLIILITERMRSQQQIARYKLGAL